ncbi:MAG TPA: hypothetical protein VLK29_06500 [Luteimonas sp.]|nr:hypothetical protein [Luteimonas sp.]
MRKRFWICCMVVSMAALTLGFLVHGIVLRADYLALAPLYRTQPDASARAGWILAAYGSIGIAMTWLYVRMPAADTTAGWRGMRFGASIAMVSFVPWHLLAYVGQPLPAALAMKQVALDVVAMLLLGLLLAWLQPERAELPLPGHADR